MNKKITVMKSVSIGLGLIAAAVVSGAVAIYLFETKGGINFMYTLMAAGLTGLVGWVMVISGILSKFEWPHPIKDDIQDLTEGKVTRLHITAILAVVATIYFGVEFVFFDKLSARWAEIPVFIIAIGVAVITWAIMNGSEWYQERDWRLSGWFIYLPLIAILLSTYFGTYLTEPVELGAESRTEMMNRNQVRNANDYESSRIGTYYYHSSYITSTGSGGGSVSAPSCSGKACEGYGIVVIIIVIILLILGSAFIPHFWIVAGGILLTMIWMNWYRELLVNEQLEFRRRGL